MRLAVLLLVGSLLAAGCLGAQDEAPDRTPSELTTVEERKAEVLANASDNATYLENDDYFEEHIHDYWGGAEERILMDEIVTASSDESARRAFFFSLLRGDPQTSVGYAAFTLPNGSFVPEGTGELRVDVDATAALRNGQLAFGYQAANADRTETMEPQAATASWTIVLEPEMADMPHSSSTRWAFALWADGAGGMLDGDISVRVTAKRLFDIQAWPEHPDFWQGGNLTRVDLHAQEGSFAYADPTLLYVTGQFTPERVLFPPGTIVPPETRVLLVTFDFQLDSDVKNNLYGDLSLVVKEGSSARWVRSMRFDAIEYEEFHRVYALITDETNWDSPYASESGWWFDIHAFAGVRAPVACEQGCVLRTFFGGPPLEVGSGTYQIDIKAFREVPPWLEEALGGRSERD